MGSNWAPDMNGGSPLFWVMAAAILLEGVAIWRLLAHGLRAGRRTVPSGAFPGLAAGERPMGLPAGGRPERQPGPLTGKGKAVALLGVTAAVAWLGLDMRPRPAATPAKAANPAARPVTVINKLPAPVQHVFHFPLSGTDIVIIVIVVAVLTTAVRINRWHGGHGKKRK
jgi:hypothetical protein